MQTVTIVRDTMEILRITPHLHSLKVVGAAADVFLVGLLFRSMRRRLIWKLSNLWTSQTKV